MTYLDDPADPPLANPDAATTAQDTPITVDVLANDTGPDLRLRHVGPAMRGTAERADDGRSISYTPDPGFCRTPEPARSRSVSSLPVFF